MTAGFTRFLRFVLVVLALPVLASVALAQSWTFTNNMNVARNGPGTTTLLDGRVLIEGGQHFPSVGDPNNNSAEIYDPSTGTWTLTSNILEGHAGHETTVRLADGRVLVCGGVIAPNPTFTNLCEIYDPVAGTWSRTGSMNQVRAHQGMVVLPTGLVLAMGGDPGTYSPFNSAELYDPSTGTWQYTGSMAVPRSAHSATLLGNGRVLVAGGSLPGGNSDTATAELYDPVLGVWIPTGSLNQARDSHIALLLGNGKVLVAGGGTGGGCPSTNSAELYDPITGTWSLTGSLSTPLQSHRAVVLNTGQGLVTGGVTAACTSPTTLSATEIYDPSSGVWSAGPSMNQARAVHGTALLSDGRVLVAGGEFGSNALSSAEILGPIGCSPEGDNAEGDGDEQGDDGHEGHFHFRAQGGCKPSGEMDFDEPDSGEGMKGSIDAANFSGNQATISGTGALLDGTPLHYMAVVLGNAPVIGGNHFAISWITSTGSSFHTSGALTAGYIVVHAPQ